MPQPEPNRMSAPPQYTPQQSRPVVASAPTRTATIGASMYVKGDIRSKEELLVDGEVEGTVESESILTVGPNGKVKAGIKAREVIIYGSVRGDVEVSDKIAIREKGSLVGNIKSAGIVIDDGAYFKGSIDIIRPDPKTIAKSAAVEAKVAS